MFWGEKKRGFGEVVFATITGGAFWGWIQLLCSGVQVQANSADYRGITPDVHQPM